MAVAALMMVGVGAASAQSFFFDYTGSSGDNTLSFVETISGQTCAPSCTLTQSSNLSGTLDFNGTDYAITFDPTNTAFGADNVFNANTGVDLNGINFEANIDESGTFYPTTFNVTENSLPGSGGTQPGVFVLFANDYTENINPGADFDPTGPLTYGEEAAPAPVVGGGAWSWLAFGLVGLIGLVIRREWVAAWVRLRVARVAPAGRLRATRRGTAAP